MEEENLDNTPRRNCLCCGRWIALQEDSKQVYCCPECARQNTRCTVCGRYFEKGKGVGEFCSPECAESHPELDDLFKELT